jgi:hypothetical protein
MIFNIEQLRNNRRGDVALLGSGESVEETDLYALQQRMPIIGINRSWKAIETPWRCFIDADNWDHIRSGEAPKPDLAIFPSPPGTKIAEIDGMNCCVMPFASLLNLPTNRIYDFHGFELDEVGTSGAFAGYLALEVAAWAGYERIWLLGYDCVGGHFFNPNLKQNQKTWDNWNDLLRKARTKLDEHGVQVINCSERSTVDAFDKGGLW